MNEWNTKEYYDCLRDLLKHEDSLMSERLRGLFTVQAILFAALGVFWKEHNGMLVSVLALLGMVSNASYGFELVMGNRAIACILSKWRIYCLSRNVAGAPPIIGYELAEKFPRWLLPGRFVAWLLFMCWVVIVLLYAFQ
ncbi:hypothetical protein [Trichocoleus sp. FACHB-262]|uniref:hypothetical protein n=1 Tax=Trichocoleus sp. FACHB-262 TaxID=2692869 RepID=UPI00168411B9|nr:hypothetical protein [Trichocoleus sp. FACHB-262]MBD2120862.1 hypothetical protein [Trichocoleus sp. FACHB-262]